MRSIAGGPFPEYTAGQFHIGSGPPHEQRKFIHAMMAISVVMGRVADQFDAEIAAWRFRDGTDYGIFSVVRRRCRHGSVRAHRRVDRNGVRGSRTLLCHPRVLRTMGNPRRRSESLSSALKQSYDRQHQWCGLSHSLSACCEINRFSTARSRHSEDRVRCRRNRTPPAGKLSRCCPSRRRDQARCRPGA
jgi:hypothetical protein